MSDKRKWPYAEALDVAEALPGRPPEHHQTTSERDVFEFIGLPYREPKDRL